MRPILRDALAFLAIAEDDELAEILTRCQAEVDRRGIQVRSRYRIGQRVVFVDRDGQRVAGRVTRINRETLTLGACSMNRYPGGVRVAYNLLLQAGE
jgi:hypothetical protein